MTRAFICLIDIPPDQNPEDISTELLALLESEGFDVQRVQLWQSPGAPEDYQLAGMVPPPQPPTI